MTLKIGFQSEFYKHIKGKKNNLYEQQTISLIGVKNSYVAFSLFLENSEPWQLALTNNSVFSIFPSQKTYRIEVICDNLSNITIYKQDYMEDDLGVSHTDSLNPIEYFDVEKFEEVPLFIKLDIDKYDKAKKYKGMVNIYQREMFKDESCIISLPFEVIVKNIIMNQTKNTMLHLNLWQHLSNIARKHEVKLFSDDHFTIIENYIKSLSYLGQKAVTVIASDIPWSGQKTFNDLKEPTDLFEYNYISVIKDSYGNFICDYSVLDRYIDLCKQYGITAEIEVFGLSGIWMDKQKNFGKVANDFPDGIRIRYYDQTDKTYKYMKTGVEIKGYIKLLYEYFIDKSIIDRVRIIADEPDDIDRYRKTINAILSIAPKFKFKAAINHAIFTKEFDDVLSDLVPSLRCLNEDVTFFEQLALKNSKRLSWYVCCRPHFPNTFIKSNLLESCFIGYLTSLLNLNGFLRWNYTAWPEKPREKISFRSDGWLAGDMNFVYPGNFGGPILTIRYFAMKRMVECYDLLERAAFKDVTIKGKIKQLLMGNTSLLEITNSGYDENSKEVPFSLDIKDYEQALNLIYNILA
ncbi:MAG: DUF4091 domain-containing protein [Clostridiales bacterium]|nr:DUF4091 domain-containing protein [Clostridiales bacterium]